MKPFLRQTLERQIFRLHEMDSLLCASDVVSDMNRFRKLTREPFSGEARSVVLQHCLTTTVGDTNCKRRS